MQLVHAAANPDTDPPDPNPLRQLADAGDVETACAAVIVGMNNVLEAGQDFARFETWREAAGRLLAHAGLPQLGRGALLVQLAIAQLLGPGRLGEVLPTLQALNDAAERAGSDAQRIVQASLRGYCEAMSGRLQVAEAIVRDALHLSPGPGTCLVPKMHLQASLGLINSLQNRVGDARDCLDVVTSSPQFDSLPTSLWLLSMGHRLLSLAIANDRPNELRSVAERIRCRSIPSHKHYYRSYTHFALGAAALLAGEADTALFHAQSSAELGRRCRSRVAERTATLLVIQALADLGQRERALDCLNANEADWKREGAGLLLASGAIEEARLLLELGQRERARAALDRARVALPAGAPLPLNLRREPFVSALLSQLAPAPATDFKQRRDARPVQISTFGELIVEIDGKRLYDRDWHGTRTKTLLKALIVLGGYKVSSERLCDMLWPDADGDVAHNNLKVALWRLRHLGCAKGAKPLPWVVVRHGHVSLASALCRVDCVEFLSELKAAQESGDPGRLCAALCHVSDDFLPGDDSEAWIAAHREYLRRIFLRNVRTLASANTGASGPILDGLCKTAARLDPLEARPRESVNRSPVTGS